MPSLRFIFFPVATFLVVLAHVYLYRRFTRGLGAGRWVTALVLLALGLSSVLSRPISNAFPSSLSGPMVALGTGWLGLALYVALSFGALDAAKVIGRRLEKSRGPGAHSPERRRFLVTASTAGAAAAAFGATAFGTYRAYSPPALTRVTVKLPRLPRELDGFTLVHLSDIHAGLSVDAAWMGDLAERCRALKPDLLAITGDLADGPVRRLGATVAALASVPTRAGRYFVTGNHDFYSGADAWCAALERMGIQPLRNRCVRIGGTGEPSFDLLGVDDFGQPAKPNGTGYNLAAVLEGRDRERPAVLLAHRPNDFDASAGSGVGLQLSGHTHGGQTFPFTSVAQLMWERCAGVYAHGESRLFVSRGVGFVGPSMRLGSPPEIGVITLVSGV